MLALQPSNSDHIKFVEIAGRDRQKPQPFKQRMAQIVSLGKHPFVERKPGELAINVARLGVRIDRFEVDWLARWCSLPFPDRNVTLPKPILSVG